MLKNQSNPAKSIEGLDSRMENMLNLYSGVNNNVGHGGKYTLSMAIAQICKPTSREKSTIVTRYQRDYLVTYTFDKEDKSPELNTIDGNCDLEDTYNDTFLTFIEDQIIEQEISHKGCGYDNN